jgi:hypothetical protein
MTTFPALIPSTRTYSPGEYPITPHPLLSGSEIRVRHSNTVLGVRLRLTFQAASSADVVAVRNHYNGRQGGFLPFSIPVELLSGVTTPADVTPAGHQWVYASRPSVVDVPIAGDTPTNRHDLVVELVTVPPENTIVAGARITVRATVRGGSAQLGAYIESFASVVGGAATVEAATSALGAAITVTTSMAFFGASGDPIVDPLTATASVIAGAASVASGGPDFANVSILLPFDSNFADVSTNLLSTTPVGSPVISTAQSQWGGASGEFGGTGKYLDIAASSLLSFPAEFSIQGWIRPGTVSSGIQTFCEIGTFSNGVLIRHSSVSSDNVYVNGTNLGALNGFFSVATWAYISVTRNGSNLVEVAVGGTVRLSATVSGTVNSTSAAGRIAQAIHTSGQALFGVAYVDDFRITKGEALPHTVPGAAFPTS